MYLWSRVDVDISVSVVQGRCGHQCICGLVHVVQGRCGLVYLWSSTEMDQYNYEPE